MSLDASCRLLGVVFQIFDALEIPHERLVAGSEVSLERLYDERGWLPWDTICDLMATASRLIGGDERLRELAEKHLMTTPTNQSFTAIARAFAGPGALYWCLERWIFAQLFASARLRVEARGGSAFRAHLVYPEHQRVMPQMPVMVGATLTCLPTVLGLPPALVQATTRGRQTTFDITAPASRSFYAGVRRAFGVLAGAQAVVQELEAQAETLRSRNQELEEARQREAEVSEARRRLLASVSHELRSPLNGILGTLQLLETVGLDAEHLELVQAGRGSAEHLTAMVESVIAFNRVQLGDTELGDDNFDVARLIAERVATGRTRLGAAVQIELQSPTEAWVRGDRQWMCRAFEPLLDNAIRFTEAGRVRVELAQAEHGWSFVITDSGPGMTPEALALAFSPLQQGNDALDRSHGGLGIGLPLAHASARAMGGQLDLTSAVGEGTVARLVLPLQPGEAPRTAATVATGPRRALVVDDIAVNRMVLARLMKKLGYEVHQAENGEEAVQRVQELSFSIVLMDIQMPVMDGHSATRAIRQLEEELGQHVPVVAVTAHASDDDRRAAFEAGMDRYLNKPVREAILSQTLAEVLE